MLGDGVANVVQWDTSAETSVFRVVEKSVIDTHATNLDLER